MDKSPEEETMTGPQWLKAGKAAYRSLASYVGTTRVFAFDTHEAGPLEPWSGRAMPKGREVEKTSARVWYLRPGRIRVKGTLAGPERWPRRKGTFEIVSDGHATWLRWTVEGNVWRVSADTGRAIAAFTGVSRGACTRIPTLLLGLWDNVGLSLRGLNKATETADDVVRDGAALRIHAPTRYGEAFFWMDPATSLLLRLHERVDKRLVHDSKVKDPEYLRAIELVPPAFRLGRHPVGVDFTDTIEIYDGTANPDLSPDLFVRPPDAPG
jgi:hypothetical protein